jgi:hypothetical protein
MRRDRINRIHRDLQAKAQDSATLQIVARTADGQHIGTSEPFTMTANEAARCPASFTLSLDDGERD